MAIQLENDKTYSIDAGSFQESLFPHYRTLLKDFRKISKSVVIFHILFLSLFTLQVAAFLFASTLFSQTALTAFILGSVVLTSFSYFILLYYFQAKRPRQLKDLKDGFLEKARQALAIPKGEIEHHLSIAHALLRLSAYLEDFEKQFYVLPEKLKNFKPFVEKWSLFCHFEDVFDLKQLLLQTAIDEHLEQIRITPSDFEVHASLANTFATLAKIYQGTKRYKNIFPFPRFKRVLQEAAEKTPETTMHAIEEFKILEYYAPNDPWVYQQLAKSYQDLGLYDEEVKAYETLLKLHPLDKDSLFRLGALYFEQGKNAKGLEIYEELKKINFKKAEDLILFYGTYRLKSSL
jgi:tetratricopeptide (TPR) repeat protein